MTAFSAMLGTMQTRLLWATVLAAAACSSSASKSPSSPSGGGTTPSGGGDSREDFATLVYAPPAKPLIDCPGGVPAKLDPEWHSMKPDDGVSAAEVYVQLDGEPSACKVGIGKFPRVCKHSDGWATTCTNHDGSRPHIGQIRCTPTALQVWVIAPEGEVRIAELPRPAGAAPCH
jgi:hypothetical protein